MFWNLVMIFLLMYTATVTPFKVAFVDTIPGLFGKFVYWFELGMDILFSIDLLVNFISAYEINQHEVEVRWGKIICYYGTSWFILDAIACVPTQLFEQFTSDGSYKSLVRLARLPRLYRLLRILRLLKMLRIVKHNKTFTKAVESLKMNTGISRMIQVTVTVFFMVHLVSCFWFLTAKFSEFHPDTWVARLGMEDAGAFD